MLLVQSQHLDPPAAVPMQSPVPEQVKVEELKEQVERLETEKLKLITAMEAEERCMLEAIQSLETNKRAVQQELDRAMQKVKELEEDRWDLDDRLSEASSRVKQACLEMRTTEEKAEEMQKRIQSLERELIRERASNDRLNQLLQTKTDESYERAEVITQLECKTTQVMDEMLALNDEFKSTKLELKEVHSKLIVKDERLKV